MQYSLLCLTKYYHAVPRSVTSADQCASLPGQSSEIHLRWRYGLMWDQEVYFDHTLTVIDWHSASIHGVLRLYVKDIEMLGSFRGRPLIAYGALSELKTKFSRASLKKNLITGLPKKSENWSEEVRKKFLSEIRTTPPRWLVGDPLCWVLLAHTHFLFHRSAARACKITSEINLSRSKESTFWCN